jgi:CRP-like cAMP-binding protein
MRPTFEQLAAIDLFASLSEDELAAVATLSEHRAVEAGTRLIDEGSSPDSLFVLLTGTAVAETGGRSFELGPGDFFGEIALLGGGRRTATVTATSSASVAVIRGSDFQVFERDFPHAVEVLQRAMEQRRARSQP